MAKLVIFGVQNIYTAELFETVRRSGLEIVAGVLTAEPEWSMSGITCVLQEDEVSPELTAVPVATPNIVPGTRKALAAKARAKGFRRFANVLDPTSVIASSVVTGLGIYVNAGAVIGATVKIDDHAYINRAVSVGHHTLIEQFATIGPSVTVASNCGIGRGAFIGAGAVIAPSCVVGANSVVGAGAVVIKDVPDNAIVVGNPARVIKEDIQGYGDVAV